MFLVVIIIMSVTWDQRTRAIASQVSGFGHILFSNKIVSPIHVLATTN